MPEMVSKVQLPDEIVAAIRQATIKAIDDVRTDALNNQYPLYLSKQEAANYLRISLNTLNEWMNSSNIPYTHIGKTYRFNRNLLDQFMSSK